MQNVPMVNGRNLMPSLGALSNLSMQDNQMFRILNFQLKTLCNQPGS